MHRKKRSLTLLEVIIAIVLLGALLAGLFNTFRHGMKQNISARELKQKVLQIELFNQKMKTLFSDETSVWMDTHKEASGNALFINFTKTADPDFEMCQDLQSMLFLNGKKELCLVVFSENGKSRIETLLDKVEAFDCRLFDPKNGEWSHVWPEKKEGRAAMAAIDLTWNDTKIPFVFFLKASHEKITYVGAP